MGRCNHFLIFAYLFLALMAMPSGIEAGSASPATSRIVALNSDSLEAICILGLQDQVVGVSSGVKKEPLLWRELAGLPAVGKWNEPNYEKIYSLRPDVVVAYKNSPGMLLNKKLPNVKVLRLDLYKPSTMLEDIRALGESLGARKKARNFILWYRGQLKHIRERISGAGEPPEVYMECYTAFHALGPGSGGYQMGHLARGNVISSEFSVPYARITSEWILRKQPEIVVKTASIDGYALTQGQSLRTIRQKVMDRPGWQGIEAIKNRRVCVLAADICAGPRAIVGIAYMAKYFYPKECADLKPEELHRQYLERFQKVAYKGRYFWPPLDKCENKTK